MCFGFTAAPNRDLFELLDLWLFNFNEKWSHTKTVKKTKNKAETITTFCVVINKVGLRRITITETVQMFGSSSVFTSSLDFHGMNCVSPFLSVESSQSAYGSEGEVLESERLSRSIRTSFCRAPSAHSPS